jgi:DNA adenine methylase
VSERWLPAASELVVEPSSVLSGLASATHLRVPDFCRRRVLSPLRYPGGKRRLLPYIAATIRENSQLPDLFLEPFAGGARVALALADIDPWIASFWQTAFEDCDWLCNKVETIAVNLETWDRLKRTKAESRRWQALACLFLNRTSFNGALHRSAGPIGGRAQSGDYDIGCRFPRDRLVKRLRACERLASKGKVAWVKCQPALEAIRDARDQAKREGLAMFTYLDPPFWAKSSQLYRYGFADFHHEELAEALRWVQEPWLLSYDVSPDISDLYHRHDARQANVELLYTGTQRAAYEELVITNLQQLPLDTKLWQTNEDRSRLRSGRRAL